MKDNKINNSIRLFLFEMATLSVDAHVHMFSRIKTFKNSVFCRTLYNPHFFERLTRNRSNTVQLNVARCKNPELIALSIITSYDLDRNLVNVPQRHLVTIAHLKFWGYDTIYSTLFTVREMTSILYLKKLGVQTGQKTTVPNAKDRCRSDRAR